jgi:cation transport regulator
MPSKSKSRGSSNSSRGGGSTELSSRTKKQIDTLPEHAQHIYKKTHASALKQYRDPKKRRDGKGQSVEQVAHKAAWSAVKKAYKKEGDMWVEKQSAA